MRNIRLAIVLIVLVWTLPLIAAEPAPEIAPEPEATCEQPATSAALGWEILDFEADLEEMTNGASQSCDPNRQCTTHAQCGQFGYCAVWRLCICSG